jgi:DDB1- and CUL4-associated factor 7
MEFGQDKVEYSSPLTSFDWNMEDINIIGTSSIDTTCTIWDIEKRKKTCQLIAHDAEVYDICFSKNPHIFGTASADGGARQFDTRYIFI